MKFSLLSHARWVLCLDKALCVPEQFFHPTYNFLIITTRGKIVVKEEIVSIKWSDE